MARPPAGPALVCPAIDDPCMICPKRVGDWAGSDPQPGKEEEHH